LGDSNLNPELPSLTPVPGIVVDHIHIRLPESLEIFPDHSIIDLYLYSCVWLTSGS